MIRWSIPVLLALVSFSIGCSVYWLMKLAFRKFLEPDPTPRVLTGQGKPGLYLSIGRRPYWIGAALIGLMVLVFVDTDLGVWALVFIAVSWAFVEWGPRWKAKFLLKQRFQALEDLFPQSLGMAIQALKIGQTIPQVLIYLSQESPSPLSEEWERVCAEIKLGSSPEDALTQMEVRLKGLEVFKRFVEAYRISRQTGANLTRLLEVLLEGMEEKSRITRRMTAMTAQARLSGLLMGSLPFFLGLVFFIMDPTMMTPLFTEKLGWGILLAAILLETTGFLWIKQLLRLEV